MSKVGAKTTMNEETLALTRALRLDDVDYFDHVDHSKNKPIVSIVGGGGKTMTMFTLANELVAQGKRVVTTTTTRLFASQRAESPAWCGANQLGQLGKLLDEHGQCLVTAPDDSWTDGKARGITVEQVTALAARDDVDAILIEADGSRKRPFKAPAEYEPVIPLETTHVVALVGADVFGVPLTAKYVHRPERIMALSGAAEGSVITPEIVACILAHPNGGLRNVSHQALFVPLINKVEGLARQQNAEKTARLLLRHERVHEVLWGSLHRLTGRYPLARSDNDNNKNNETAIAPLNRASRTAAVVLAAGMATRFGQTKQLLMWQGQPLVAHVAQMALAHCHRVLVIVGHEGEKVAKAVAHLPVEVVWNEQFAQGQGTSVAAGAAALLAGFGPFVGEAFFMLADQPLVTPELLKRLQKARGLHPIAVPCYQGKRGNPVLFDHSLLPALCEAKGDVGGRALFERYRDDVMWLETEDGAVLRDIDTPEDWEKLNRA